MSPNGSIPPVIGIVGWKKSGKTTLTTRLITDFARRGLKIATIKHAHHNFQIDDGETDSARHRRAGAAQVAVVSARRWALVRELQGAPEPDLMTAISWFEPCDLVIVEGYKYASIPKIEVRRAQSVSREPLAEKDRNVIAIAADHIVNGHGLPVFALDDVVAIADFVVRSLDVATARNITDADAPPR
jgi:molybdopterin-guanine dinucleotide biosynthesis protein B